MPLENVRFRFKRLPNGRKQRLAFRGDTVIEAVTYDKEGHKTGARHTPAEFAADRKRRALRVP